MKNIILILIISLALTSTSFAQGIVGIWDRVDSIFGSSVTIQFDEEGGYIISEDDMFIWERTQFPVIR